MSQIIHDKRAQELREQILHARLGLRETLSMWFHLQNDVRPALLAKYDEHFRQLTIDIQKTTLEASEIGRRVELLTMKQQRGEPLTAEIVALVNKIVDNEFKALHDRMRSAFDIDAATRESEARAKIEAVDETVPQMYRTIVKKLHPDTNADSEEFRRFWQSVQDAYKSRDARRLESIYRVLVEESDDATEEAPASIESLQAQLNSVQSRLSAERRKIERLKAQEPFSIEVQLSDPIWLDAHKTELETELESKRRDLCRFNAHYASLVGKDYAYEPSAEDWKRQKEEKDFQTEFQEQTYFRR